MLYNLSESQEDYLEAIYNEIAEKGGVRVKNIASRMGVAMPTVTAALKSLKKEGLVDHEPYGVISLTEIGEEIAKGIVETHQMLCGFFKNTFRLKKEKAEEMACKMEHIVSDDMMVQFADLIYFMNETESADKSLTERFHKYVDRKK